MSDSGQNEGRHLDAGALDRYRRRVAPPDELLAADAHLAVCNFCFAAVRERIEEIELPSPAGEGHLSYEELEAFVDSRADALDRELVTAHVTLCPRCHDELSDLAATRDTLAPRPPRPAGRVMGRYRTR